MAPSRQLHAFYEVGSEYAVDPSLAHALYEGAVGLIGRYAGGIALASVRGARIPLGDRPASPVNVRFGNYPHTALLTRRSSTGLDGQQSQYCRGHSARSNTPGSEGYSAAVVTIPRPEDDPTGTLARWALAHELGHTFGLPNCTVPNTTCVMRTDVAFKWGAPHPAMISERPFCDPCAENLELAGYEALAYRMSNPPTAANR